MEVAGRTGASILPHITIYDGRHDRHNVFVGNPKSGTGSVQDLFNFLNPIPAAILIAGLASTYLICLKLEV